MDAHTRCLLAASGIGDDISAASDAVEMKITPVFTGIDSVREYNQYKVLEAMRVNKVSDTHFAGTTGYGYDDRGRETLDAVYADVFKAGDALVRHQIVSGTHALALCMFGILRPGGELVSVTGKPYDTLEEAIGIRGSENGSLKEFGISYKQVELAADGGFDYDAIEGAIGPNTGMVFIQRSRGYCWRASMTVNDIAGVVKHIRKYSKDAVILVDNCYGEFTECSEPVEAGADLVAGSLIKNPGGGLAPTGGYIAGRSDLVEKAANRLASPGMGKKVGSSLGNNRMMFQGLFMAPHVVGESLKGSVYCAAFMERLGFDTSPGYSDKRGDIIQAVKFGDRDRLIAFCQGIQKGSPVDSFVAPQPWDMPGYDCPVIMAAGGFIQGASIELSADAPVKPPYIAYMQGGLVYEHVKFGVMNAINMIRNA